MKALLRKDVGILGGGLVGGLCACALADQGFQVALIDPAPLGDGSNRDARTTSISYGSSLFLKHLGIWDALSAESQPIKTICVSEAGHRSVLTYRAKDLGEPALGYMVLNSDLRKAILGAIKKRKGITFFNPDQVTSFHVQATSVELDLESKKRLSVALLIGSDGRHSPLRQHLGLKVYHHSYPHHAMVFKIAHTLDHEGTAFEHFLPSGPLAVLPLSSSHSGIVWMDDPAVLQDLKKDHATLVQGFFARFGSILGQVALASTPVLYPLALSMPHRVTAPSTILIGDAAHGIHPVAGQGLNLGIRDVIVLERILREACISGMNLGSPLVTEQYERQRRLDQWSMAALTHGTVLGFSWDFPFFSFARKCGMTGIERVSSLKREMARHAMGLSTCGFGNTSGFVTAAPDFEKSI